jgi:hypothetical protein
MRKFLSGPEREQWKIKVLCRDYLQVLGVVQLLLPGKRALKS